MESGEPRKDVPERSSGVIVEESAIRSSTRSPSPSFRGDVENTSRLQRFDKTPKYIFYFGFWNVEKRRTGPNAVKLLVKFHILEKKNLGWMVREHRCESCQLEDASMAVT